MPLKIVFDIWRWIVSLDSKKIVIFLFSLVITLLLLENYNLRNDNNRLSDRSDARDLRNDSNKAILEKRLQDCEAEKFSIIQESNKYWAAKVAELEERLYEDYKTVKKLKRK